MSVSKMLYRKVLPIHHLTSSIKKCLFPSHTLIHWLLENLGKFAILLDERWCLLGSSMVIILL